MKRWQSWALVGTILLLGLAATAITIVRSEIRFESEVWGTVSDWVSAAIIAMSAIGAWVAVQNARQLREAQTRPFVVVDVEAPLVPFFDMVIKNTGPTVARNVKLTFEPELESSFDGKDGREPIAAWIIVTEGIRSLPPGREYRFLFDRGYSRKETDLPDVYQVTVNYDGPTAKNTPTYTDHYTIDLSPYWGMEAIKPKTIHDIGQSIDKLQKGFKNWTKEGQ